jgi:transglutaminase-like putative cysteine protease
MTMAPLLLAAAVLFWGWQTGAWAVALPVAILFAAARILPLRWDFSHAQLCRVADFCTVLILLLTGYLLIAYGNPRGIILVFQWLPVAMLPLALAHAYGTPRALDLSVLFWNLRRHPAETPVLFDPSFPYFAIWVLAASAANVRGEAFYLGVALLVAWPMALARPRSFSLARWSVALMLALALGYGGQYALRESQLWLEGAVPDWMTGSGSRTDPYRSMTDIGHIGELKQSDAIVLRVTRPGGGDPPRLLHRASYNTYAAGSWIAQGAPFASVPPPGRGADWVLAPGSKPSDRILVHDFSPQVSPVLSLPSGTVAVEGLAARRFTRNRLGAVQVERDPGYFSYVAAFTPGVSSEAPPRPEDLRLSHGEREHFAQLAREIGLRELSPQAAIERMRRHFQDNFQYATFQARAAREPSPMVDFMRRTRAGHCEYFASATVLLLRAAGLPARYATGFAVQEYSDLESAWIVRQRHAHAWARVHVDGAWTDVDTTPPQWFVVEAGAAPAWAGVSDLWSWLRFRAAQTWSRSDEYLYPATALIVLPFVLWLAWRLYRTRTREHGATTAGSRGEWPGMDSELYLIEQHLNTAGWGRRQHETVTDWVHRLRAELPLDAGSLLEIAELHCRYRFDPAGLSPAERTRLGEAVRAWLAHGIPNAR